MGQLFWATLLFPKLCTKCKENIREENAWKIRGLGIYYHGKCVDKRQPS